MVDQLCKCVRTDLSCADIWATTGRVLSRNASYDAKLTRAVLQARITACQSCGEECAQHADARPLRNRHRRLPVVRDACKLLLDSLS